MALDTVETSTSEEILNFYTIQTICSFPKNAESANIYRLAVSPGIDTVFEKQFLLRSLAGKTDKQQNRIKCSGSS